jgi:hypothetical protein
MQCLAVIVSVMGTTNALANRKRALLLAARAGTDPRTALRAIVEGVDSIRTLATREALRAAIEDEERSHDSKPHRAA